MSHRNRLISLMEAEDDEATPADPFAQRPTSKLSRQHRPVGSTKITAKKDQGDRAPDDAAARAKRLNLPPSKRAAAWQQTRDFLDKHTTSAGQPLTPAAGSTAVPKFPGQFVGQTWTTSGLSKSKGGAFHKFSDPRSPKQKLYGYENPDYMSSRARQAHVGSAPPTGRASVSVKNDITLVWNGEEWVSPEEFKTTKAPKSGKVQAPPAPRGTPERRPMTRDGYRISVHPSGGIAVYHVGSQTRGLWKPDGTPKEGDLTTVSTPDELEKIGALVKDFSDGLGEAVIPAYGLDDQIDVAFRELLGDIREKDPGLYRRLTSDEASGDPAARNFMRQVRQRAKEMKGSVREALIGDMCEGPDDFSGYTPPKKAKKQPLTKRQQIWKDTDDFLKDKDKHFAYTGERTVVIPHEHAEAAMTCPEHNLKVIPRKRFDDGEYKGTWHGCPRAWSHQTDDCGYYVMKETDGIRIPEKFASSFVREHLVTDIQEVDLGKMNIKKVPHASPPVNSQDENHDDEAEDIEDLGTASDVIDAIELSLRSLRHLLGDVEDHEREEASSDDDDEEDDVDEGEVGFKRLKRSLAHQKGVRDPGALAASIGRKKYGSEEMARRSAKGRKG